MLQYRWFHSGKGKTRNANVSFARCERLMLSVVRLYPLIRRAGRSHHQADFSSLVQRVWRFGNQLAKKLKILEEYFNAHLDVPGSKAFKGMWKRRGSEMLQQDLTDIGIDLEDELGAVSGISTACVRLCQSTHKLANIVTLKTRHATITK